MTPKDYNTNPVIQDGERHCIQVDTRDGHIGTQTFVDTVETDTQTNPNAETMPTKLQMHIGGQRP